MMFRSSPKGQAVLEFAFVVPFLVAMGMLILDGANLISVQNRLNAAVREGAKLLSELGDRTFGSHPDCSLNFSPPVGPTDCNVTSSRCCDALQRAYRVAVESGVRNLQVRGQWTIRDLSTVNPSRSYIGQYRLFTISANAGINLFLGFGGTVVTAQMTSYGGEVR